MENIPTNNCPGNIDYSPLAPTDTLNTRVSPRVAGVMAASAVDTAISGPAAGIRDLTAGLTGTVTTDIANPSLSMSITEHDGDTFVHIDIP